MKRSHLLMYTVAGILLTASFAAITSNLILSSSTLLRHARKVAALPDWRPNTANYFWLSPNTVLVLRQDVLSASYGDTTIVHAWRFDLTHRTQKELTELETTLNAVPVQSSVAEWQISPDKTWLLGFQSGNTPSPQWIAVTLDGHRVVHRSEQYNDDMSAEAGELHVQPPWQDVNFAVLHTFWAEDSRSWFHLSSEYDGAGLSQFWLRSSKRRHVTLNFMPGERVVVGFVSPGRVLCLYNHTGDGGGVGMVNFPTTGMGPAAIYYAHIPANYDVREVALSPDGKRLAWKFAVKPLPFGLAMTRDSSFVRRSQPDRVGIWVSNLDCTGLRRIGTVSTTDALSNLRWCPDNKNLSFVYQNALYTVPAQ